MFSSKKKKTEEQPLDSTNQVEMVTRILEAMYGGFNSEQKELLIQIMAEVYGSASGLAKFLINVSAEKFDDVYPLLMFENKELAEQLVAERYRAKTLAATNSVTFPVYRGANGEKFSLPAGLVTALRDAVGPELKEIFSFIFVEKEESKNSLTKKYSLDIPKDADKEKVTTEVANAVSQLSQLGALATMTTYKDMNEVMGAWAANGIHCVINAATLTEERGLSHLKVLKQTGFITDFKLGDKKA